MKILGEGYIEVKVIFLALPWRGHPSFKKSLFLGCVTIPFLEFPLHYIIVVSQDRLELESSVI